MHHDTRSYNLLKKPDPVLSACTDCGLFWTEIFFESATKNWDSFRAVPAASSLYAPIIPLSKITAIKNCQKVAKSVILPVKNSRQQSPSWIT